MYHTPSTPIFWIGGPALGDANIKGDSVLLPVNPDIDCPSPMPIGGGPLGGIPPPIPGPLLPWGIASVGGIPGPLVSIPDGGIPGPDEGPESTLDTAPDNTPGTPGPVGGRTPGPTNRGE